MILYSAYVTWENDLTSRDLRPITNVLEQIAINQQRDPYGDGEVSTSCFPSVNTENSRGRISEYSPKDMLLDVAWKLCL